MSQSIPLSKLESAPSAKFANVGDSYSGRITAMDERPQTDPDMKPVYFSDGTPRMQWVISIQQANGESISLYAKGGNYKPSKGSGESMLVAIGSAGRAAGVDAIDVGGELAVAFTGTQDFPGGKQAKLYTAQYRPPEPQKASIPVDLFSQ